MFFVTRSSRFIVLTASFLSLTNVFAFLLVAQNVGVASVLAQLFTNGNSRSVQAIPTCRDVGLCPKGKRGVVLHSVHPNAIAAALERGCTVHRTLRENTVLRCPLKASIPYSHEDRVFRLNDLYSLQQIGAPLAQEHGVTGQGVRVAILDTGVEATHPELSEKIALTENFTDDSIDDAIGHGTHVSGIVGGQGVQSFDDRGSLNSSRGVAQNAELLSAKVCNNQGWCLEGDIQAGIEWAVTQKARVINLSVGGGAFLDHCDRDNLAKEVNWAVNQGVIVIAATGNGGDAGEGISTPGCASQAIAVGAVDGQDVRPPWSSYGQAIDVSAPGVSILSSVSCLSAGTCPNPAYGWWSGTSMATPQVTGLVALLLQVQPSLTRDQVYSLLTSTAVDLGDAGFDTMYGYGRIDAKAALAAVGYEHSNPSSSSSSLSSSSSSSSSSLSSSSSSSSSSLSSSSSSSSSSSLSSSSSSSSSSSTISSSVSSTMSSEQISSAERMHEAVPGWGAHSESNTSNPSTERQKVPTVLPELPSNAAPAAREHRPTVPRGSPRW